MKKLIILFATGIFFTGCLCKKHTEKTVQTNPKSEEVKPAIIDEDFMQVPEKLDYTIKSVTIEENTLIVDVEYKGGKAEHDFSLIFNGMYMKSYPLKVKLFIKHENNGDTGEETTAQKLKFDLKPVQSPGGEPMIISVYGFNQPIKYNY